MEHEVAGRWRPAAGAAAYGLAAVVVADARQALGRVLGDRADEEWSLLSDRAGVTGAETDPEAVDRVIRAMQAWPDPVVALCGRSLLIRVSSHRHLSATQDLVRGV